MNALRFYKLFSIGLLVLNLVLIGCYIFPDLMKRKGHMPPPPLRGAIVHQLHFEKAQAEAFKESAEQHKETIQALEEQRASAVRSYFQGLYKTQSDSVQQVLLTKIQDIEKNKIEVTYQHFEDLKAICTEEQLPLFPGALDEVLNHILLGTGPKPGPPPPRRH
jgi:hypothetical protein